MAAMSNKPSFTASADAKTLADLLRCVNVGEVLAYDDMNAALGRDVTADRNVLYTARAIVQREDRMVFDAVLRVGIKRLADAEIVNLGDRARARVRRISRTVSQAITCVDYAAMSREAQVKHNTALSMFGVMAELATNKSFAKLESHVVSAGTELPVGKASIAALGLIFGNSKPVSGDDAAGAAA